jgi:hypothetical protein
MPHHNGGIKLSRNITSPLDFFGHQLGADRKMARWDKIVEYFYLLESESDRLKVINMGPSTEGQPFLAVIISSPENLDRLDYYKAINKQITDPGNLTEEEIKIVNSKYGINVKPSDLLVTIFEKISKNIK